MLRKYNLQDHTWINSLHKIRHKWSSAFNKDSFDGGIELPQRGESLNNVLNGIADKSASLTEFILAFEKLVEDWRKNEAEEDYRSNRREPLRAIKHSDILRHAGQVYTHKLYKVFENEFLDGCGATSVEETPCGGTASGTRNRESCCGTLSKAEKNQSKSLSSSKNCTHIFFKSLKKPTMAIYKPTNQLKEEAQKWEGQATYSKGAGPRRFSELEDYGNNISCSLMR
ncbi:Protein FAR1-RELATED SEQUENCE 9 [Ananas comosus]|uniref:Protein FAR1-RELATED SEQUENCE n=1 Tax=Ananas comosus TaxID=4615 RepID=A0A199VYC4_ANACO|nr:Protein FAR1-RELATED SEQUENCE 9 [Ananas comosus]